MHPTTVLDTRPRHVCFVLSARSLPYATLAFRSLVEHALAPLRISVITDGAEDKSQVEEALAAVGTPAQHSWHVHTLADADARAQNAFSKYPHIARFRTGHPCWRKITDPLLFTPAGEEVIVLDPDLYFPNYFSFEPTPPNQLLLMWQQPHCLLPPETVAAAYRAGVKLAHHADIGVAQLHNSLDLGWLDWLIIQLGGSAIPPIMHVEPIIWSALAMRLGGGYLDPRHWHCWRNSQVKRVRRRLGYPGHELLRTEPFGSIKCFHAGGVAKWWLQEAVKRGYSGAPTEITVHYPPVPFEELTARAYQQGQRLKRFARWFGYYRLFRSSQ